MAAGAAAGSTPRSTRGTDVAHRPGRSSPGSRASSMAASRAADGVQLEHPARRRWGPVGTELQRRTASPWRRRRHGRGVHPSTHERTDRSCTIWYMITESSISIDAPAASSGTSSPTSSAGRSGRHRSNGSRPSTAPASRSGSASRSSSPASRSSSWEVTEVEPGAAWTWRQRSPGGTTLATPRGRAPRRRPHARAAAHRPAGPARRGRRPAHAAPHEALPRPRGPGLKARSEQA